MNEEVQKEVVDEELNKYISNPKLCIEESKTLLELMQAIKDEPQLIEKCRQMAKLFRISCLLEIKDEVISRTIICTV